MVPPTRCGCRLTCHCVCARARADAQPTDEDVNYWHDKYCEALHGLFERYKGTNPDYKHKELLVE